MNKKNIIKLSKKLISIPSTGNDKKALLQSLEAAKPYLEKYKVKSYRKNGINSLLAYNVSKLPKKFRVILNGHLDVVSANKDQFKPVIKGDKLFGRGAIDMKTAAAVEILVFSEIAEKVTYPLGLQLVTDEEVGGFNGTKYQISQGVKTDFVIAGEHTDFAINNQAKGILWVKITAKGKVAHGAYPWEGDNAVKKMNEFVNKLVKKYPVPDKEAWRTTVNLSQINTSNKTFNKVPDDCMVALDIRYVPEEKSEIVKNIKKLVPKEFDIEIVEKEPPQKTDINNKNIKNLKKIISEVMGKPVKTINKHGASDIRHYDDAGCPGVCFGPVGKGLHSDNEWVSIESLDTYYEILMNFLLST
ncbi:MAG: M20/M25/M40 family metallo-hydrolase [Candidatus Woesebacteria bacterium]|jgi:succinyl-diaminopimelate desuccinylase